MKLHSNKLGFYDVTAALTAAQQAGKVTSDILFVQLDASGSRSREYGYEVQLGTFDKTTGPTNSRHYKNSGNRGAGSVYAATYDEWGWFIAELFRVDPDLIFGGYKGVDDFHKQTKNAYR